MLIGRGTFGFEGQERVQTREETKGLTAATRLTELVQPTVEHMGYSLWGVERLGSGRRGRVCVYIDAEKGITFDDCAAVSQELMMILEVENVLNDDQVLEVSSPGLDRKLFSHGQYVNHIGHEVDVRLHFAIDGKKRIRGVMTACNEDDMVVDDQRIEFEKVRFTRLVPQFD